MIKNIGGTDRAIRALIGILLVYLGYSISPWIYIPAAIVLFTAIFSYCGLYQVLGISTCPIKKARK